MELRVLQYFLAVAREGSISGAAEALHLSQPTLSRQLKDMEAELGKPLLIRGSRKVTLTQEGVLLRRRAEEIVSLVRKAETEISLSDTQVAGDITVGAAETDGMEFLVRAARDLQTQCPGVHFHIVSGDRESVTEELEEGVIDFGLLLGTVGISRYAWRKLPATACYGVLMRRDAPLSQRMGVRAEDLWDKPLILSRQMLHDGLLQEMLRRPPEGLNVVATYNLLYNGSLLVDAGMGYALCLDKILNTAETNLCFRPLLPQEETGMYLLWKKEQPLSRAALGFVEKIDQLILQTRG